MLNLKNGRFQKYNTRTMHAATFDPFFQPKNMFTKGGLL